MKKIVRFLLTILSLILLLLGVDRYLIQSSRRSTEGTLTIYNWGDYIDPSLITAFEEETGLQVIYETLDSNEAMYTKVQQGGTAYDIVIKSKYMIERMIDEDLLRQRYRSNIERMNHLIENCLDLIFHTHNQYSGPYFWGTLATVYNDTMITQGEITSWEDFSRPGYKNSLLLI